jgi:TOMM system kinase/cyclase fusion protein
MFCDLVGSTQLSAQLDPEELRKVVRAYQEVSSAVIRRFEGHIAQYLGDGLLVYFGYPAAHEDDAKRAVSTGLGIVEAIGGLNPHLHRDKGVELAVRVGIHTGLVVVGEMGGEAKKEQLAMGETPNIAARLQGLAEPNTVVISSATYHLIQGFFDCHDLGTHSLKGISQPIGVYRALHESTARSRLEVAATKGLTPLVGREQEIGLLFERWEQAKEGFGQVALLSGEPGIGKSRLVEVLKEHVATDPKAWMTPCQCSPYHQNSALYPVIDLLERVVLQFDREDSPQKKLGKIEGFLAQYGLSLPETVPLFASLLSVPLAEGYSPLNLSPEQQKQRTFQAMLTAFLERASRQPLLLVVEDLHWADPSTMELLGLIVDQVTMARILAVFTHRPDFISPWGTRSYLSHLTLSRLPRRQVEMMVERVAGGKKLPVEVLEQLVVKTDGVPLFVEELTKMVIESGLLREQKGRYELTGPLPPLAIPTTLQDSLMARLDRLAAAREVAQLGATLGREFSYELLKAVSTVDEGTLQQALAKLVEAELLYQRGLPPQATYLFKHALIQEAAYQSLLKSKRQQYHQRIAQVLEERFPETTEAQPELPAHHYTEAGLTEQAIPYWQKAGERAVERSANVEAIEHLTRGLELLKTLPESPDRAQQELGLQIALGPAYRATKGYAAPEVEETYARSRELCKQLGETPKLLPVLLGLRGVYTVRGELQIAYELAEQLMALAQRDGDPASLSAAHLVLGATLFWLGEFAPALAHVEQVLALYDSKQNRSHFFLYGGDPAASLSIQSLILWLLGYPDKASKRSVEALTLSREMSHSYSLTSTLLFTARFHQFRREGQMVQEIAETIIRLSGEQGFPEWLVIGTILQGWALAEQGRREEGISRMRQGLDAHRAIGAELSHPYFLALLAEACEKAGQAEEGLTTLAEALALVDKNGERNWEAEVYRLRGELLLRVGEEEKRKEGEKEKNAHSPTPPFSLSSPQECFHKAIEVARRQQAKSLELRAAMSLSRLWGKQEKKEEARKMLSEIYGWFTEGFDTADLKEAKALLEELS